MLASEILLNPSLKSTARHDILLPLTAPLSLRALPQAETRAKESRHRHVTMIPRAQERGTGAGAEAGAEAEVEVEVEAEEEAEAKVTEGVEDGGWKQREFRLGRRQRCVAMCRPGTCMVSCTRTLVLKGSI